MATQNKDKYFASYDFNDPRYLDELIEKVNIYRRYCESSGKQARWQRAIQNYYGVSTDGGKSSNTVTKGGDEGQLTMAKINDYRNLLQNQLILITQQRPAGEAKAINSDPDSLKEARIGSSLVEYYLSQIGWEQKFSQACERAILVDEAFAVLDWNATTGQPVRPEMDEMGQPTGKMLKTGDAELRIFSPWNMARDPFVSSPDDMKWGIASWRVNKFDLAAKYPQFSDDILSGASKKIDEVAFNQLDEDDTDQIDVFCLYHDKTDVVQDGRITLFVAEKVILDGSFPYAEFNIYRMAQNEMIDSGFGYTNNNDLLAIEEVTDALHSIAISNNVTFGTQALLGVKGANFDYTQISKGFVYFEVDPAHFDKFKALQLTSTAPETYNYMQTLDRKKETLAGINSLVRSGPDKALDGSSGSALALIQAQSIQYQSGGQKSYYQMLSRVCTGLIMMLQKFADSEIVIKITGDVQGQYLESLKISSQNLQRVSSVVFELTNPIEKTIGGKETLAKDLLQGNMIKNARQYITVARTGNLDSFTEDDEADELALKSENKNLRDGKPVQVVIVENHEEHIKSHMSVIASPEAKQNADLLNTTLAHITEHSQTWMNLSMSNPAILIATGQKVLPVPPPMGAPGPGGPGPSGSGHPMPPPTGQGPQAGPNQMKPNGPPGIRPPNLPHAPINPLTHQPAPMPPGAMVSK